MTRLILAVVVIVLIVPASASAVAPFRPAGVSVGTDAVDAARAAVDQRPGAFDGADRADLSLTSADRGPGNVTVVRLEQQIDGVPVLGGEVVVALDGRRRVVAGSGEILDGPGPDTHARLTADAARSIALRRLGQTHGLGLVASAPDLVIFDPTLFGGPGTPGGTLVWDMTIEREPGLLHRVLLDADRGTVVLDIDELAGAKERYVCDAANSGNTTAAIGGCDASDAQLVRAEGGAAVTLADANDAYLYAGTTYDFYAMLGRDSIDGAGMPMRSTVRGCKTTGSCPMANAYWNSDHMVYGAGFASAEDVVAHELTHGVTDHESGLLYWMQSGAISESMSDVFGEFVDLTYGGDANVARWSIGEDIPGGAIRSMSDPTLFGDPDSTDSNRYYSGQWDNGGVHVNSGVGNKAAYLMVDGGTFGGQTVTGIGIPKAARVWYQAQRLLRSSASYADLAAALEDGCATLVGTAAITADDCTQVGRATAAVKMSVSPRLAPVTQAPVCSAGTLKTHWGDSFEVWAGQWTFGAVTGSNLWYRSDADGSWGYAASGRYNLFAYDANGANDAWVEMANGVAVPAGAYLRFSHGFDFDVDGGTVEYSANGGAWTDVSALGVSNGYTGTISTAYDNPREGTAAFTGTSSGMTSTRVDLSSLAGQSVRFRFRYANDSVTAWRWGWYLDDVVVYTCDAQSTTNTTVTVARQVTAHPSNGTVHMVASGQAAGTQDVLCRYGDGSCTVPSSAGSFVTLRAVPDASSTFVGWSGASCSGTATTCTVTATQARSATATFAYTGPTPPEVTSFAPVTASPTTATTLVFRLAFDEAVGDLAAGDIASGATGSLACGTPTIAGVGGSTSTYDVTYASCSGSGTLQPTLAQNAVADGEATTGPTSPVQAASAISRESPTPPGIASFHRIGATPTASSSPSFRIEFDEDVTGVAQADFGVATTGSLSCSVASTGAVSSDSYSVTTSCSGVGTVAATFAVNGALDGLGTAGPTALATSEVTTVDTQAPGVVSFVRIGSTPTTSTTPAFRVTFDEDVTTVDPGDFDDTTTGSLSCAVGAVTPVSARIYDVGTYCSTGTGTVAVVLAAGGAEDGIGTSGPSSAVTSAETQVDTEGPVVVAFVRIGSTPTTSTTPTFRVTFDEEVTGIDAGDFAADAWGGLSCVVTGVTVVSARVYDVVTACSGEGAVEVQLDADSAFDALGSVGPGSLAVSQSTAVVAPRAPEPPPATGGGAVAAAPTPASGGGGGTAAPTSAPSLKAGSVAWQTTGGTVAPSFPAAAGTTYRISASRAGKATAARGRCAVAAGTGRCRISLARGSWRVAITPVRGGVAGTPVVKPVRVR